MKNIILKTLFLFAGFTSFAIFAAEPIQGKASDQNETIETIETLTFMITEASKNIDVKMEIKTCAESFCEGPAAFQLFKKDEKTPFQTINLPKARLSLGANKNLDPSWVIFDDFNFDGQEDLALKIGNLGQYGNPSYDVFLFEKTNKLFTKNRALTKLASDYSGLFQVDPDKKEIETTSISGNAWSQIVRYQIVNNLPKRNYEETVVAESDVLGKVTIRKLVNGKWRKTTKIVNRNDYFNGRKQN